MKKLLPILLVLSLLIGIFPAAQAAGNPSGVSATMANSFIPVDQAIDSSVTLSAIGAVSNAEIYVSSALIPTVIHKTGVTINAGGTLTIDLSLFASKAMAKSNEKLPVSISVTYDGGTYEIDLDVYLFDNTPIVDTGSYLVVEKLETSKSSIKSSDEVTFTVTVYNKAYFNLPNFKLEMKADDGLNNLSIPSATLTSFPGGARRTFSFTYKPSDGAASKFYSVTATASYQSTDDGDTTRFSSSLGNGVYVQGATTPTVEEGKISASAPTVSKKQVGPGEEFVVSMKITNNGTVPVYGLQTTVVPEEGVVNKTQNIVLSGQVNAGETKTVEFTLFPKDGVTTKNYSIGFTVDYYGKNGDAESKRSLSQYAGIFVQGKETKPDDEDSKTVPKIIISKYVITPQIVQAGTQFDLSMEFMNTSSLKDVRNIKIFLTTDETVEKKGSVFTPVGSSNTFYVDSIPTKGSVTRDITLYTVPDATQKTYTVNVKFQYEDADGNAYEAIEMVGVPVVQQAKMQTSELSMATEAYMGQQNYMSMQFYNTGKETMNNLIVRVEGEGFESQTPTYFVGNFEPGSQDYYENAITPTVTGTIDGKVIFEYEDAAGELQQFVKEFSMNSMEMPMTDPNGGGDFPMPEPEPQGLGIWLYVIIGAGALVVAAVIFIILRRRKKKRQASILDEEAV